MSDESGVDINFDYVDLQTKNKGGRPRKEIDFVLLENLVKLHCTGEECASVMNIDYDTLNARIKDAGFDGFSDYHEKHAAMGKMSLRRAQMKTALGGNVTMLIWLGKQYLNQKDKIEQGGTTTRVNLDATQLTDDQLEAFLKAKKDDDQ